MRGSHDGCLGCKAAAGPGGGKSCGALPACRGWSMTTAPLVRSAERKRLVCVDRRTWLADSSWRCSWLCTTRPCLLPAGRWRGTVDWPRRAGAGVSTRRHCSLATTASPQSPPTAGSAGAETSPRTAPRQATRGGRDCFVVRGLRGQTDYGQSGCGSLWWFPVGVLQCEKSWSGEARHF